MAFAVQTRTHPAVTGRDPTVHVLDDGAGGRAEVWPALGFNCFHWETVAGGRTLDLLYADPALFADGRPTRSGIPILFPFPNRIRDGRFSWDGKQYQLPINDPTMKNAIHGFACRRAWRVVGHGADAASAWVTGEFQTGRDAPDCLPFWPADHLIRVTHRLGAGRLRVEAEVVNPDSRPLPFGLGYHPYYRVPFASNADAADCLITVPARRRWVLDESLPTGEMRPVDAADDLTAPRRFADLKLDDVLTDVPSAPADVEKLFQGPPAPTIFSNPDKSGGWPRKLFETVEALSDRGSLRSGGVTLRLLASAVFREVVVFSPPHRQAFCVEPYTCATDAVNLQQRGVDAGLLVLPPGGRWAAVFEMRVEAGDIRKATP